LASRGYRRQISLFMSVPPFKKISIRKSIDDFLTFSAHA
jgi:hypothetical protein